MKTPNAPQKPCRQHRADKLISFEQTVKSGPLDVCCRGVVLYSTILPCVLINKTFS